MFNFLISFLNRVYDMVLLNFRKGELYFFEFYILISDYKKFFFFVEMNFLFIFIKCSIIKNCFI